MTKNNDNYNPYNTGENPYGYNPEYNNVGNYGGNSPNYGSAYTESSEQSIPQASKNEYQQENHSTEQPNPYPANNETYTGQNHNNPPVTKPDGYYQNGKPYYAYQAQPPQSTLNVMAIVAIITSFFFFPIGLIFGIIGYKQSKKENDANGKTMSIAAIIVSGIQVLFFAIFILFIFTSASTQITMY